MADLFLLLMIVVIALQLWHLRGISESAKVAIKHYCEQHKLQLISVSRARVGLNCTSRNLAWKCDYKFEFATSGEAVYCGKLRMLNMKKQGFDVQVYK